jgi:NitT/TauT family transport system substrate-binding protein
LVLAVARPRVSILRSVFVKKHFFICGLTVVAFGLFGCGRPRAELPAKPAALRKVVLQTDWFPQAEHGGFYQALAKGFYAEAGLEVEILPGGPGMTMKLNVAKGVADFGMYRSDDVIVAASRGIPLMMVGAVLQHDPEILLVHDSDPVRALSDLGGRTIIAPLSATWVAYVQKKYGIKINQIPPAYGVTVFLGDPNALQQAMVTSEPYFVAQHGVKFRTIPLADENYDPYHTIICRQDLARTDPELIRVFLAASIRGWRDYLEGDPAPANALILKRNPQMTPEQIAFSRDALKTRALVEGDPAKGEDIGQFSMARIERQIALLTELKILEKPVRAESVATREFLPTPSTASSSK